MSAARRERNFIAAFITAGVAEDSARRLLAAIRRNGARARAGIISAQAAQRANEALTLRVLA